MDAIRVHGFRDGKGSYGTANTYEGVWVSDGGLGPTEGAQGEYLVSIEIPDEVVAVFEWVEQHKPYREFLVPAAVLNLYDIVDVVKDEQP